MSLELRGSALVREPKGLRVDGPAPNENGQATTGPAVPVECRIDVDNETLSQGLHPLVRSTDPILTSVPGLPDHH